MRFDSRYAAYKLVESMSESVGLLPTMPKQLGDADQQQNC